MWWLRFVDATYHVVSLGRPASKDENTPSALSILQLVGDNELTSIKLVDRRNLINRNGVGQAQAGENGDERGLHFDDWREMLRGDRRRQSWRSGSSCLVVASSDTQITSGSSWDLYIRRSSSVHGCADDD